MMKYALKNIGNGINYIRYSFLFVAVVITIIQLFFYFANQDKMQLLGDPIERNRERIYEFLNSPSFTSTEEGKTISSVHRIFLCWSIGEACTDNPNDADDHYNDSIVGKVGNLLILPYKSPPASGVLWAMEGAQNAGLVPSAYAQGVGFYALQPLVPIWKIFRDISYMVLVLIIVIIGFMIMMRKQINPQTEIAITNVLPRIVITLIAITFSFAIAGFLIDLMYLVMGLGGGLIISHFGDPSFVAMTGDAESKQLIESAQGMFSGDGWWMFDHIVMNNHMWKTGSAMLSFIPQILGYFLRFIVGGIAAGALLIVSPKWGKMAEGIPFAQGFLKTVITSGWTALVIFVVTTVLFPFIISAIVFITALFIFLRIFFMLFVTYVKILLLIIFAPIILLFEAFPGTSTFGFWMKSLTFNLMMFPTVAVLIMAAGLIAFTANYSTAQALIGFDAPEKIFGARTLWAPPFLYSVESEGFIMIVSISIIFIIPDIIAWMKKMFNIGDLPFTVSPGTLLAGGGVIGSSVSGLVMRSRSLTREFGKYNDGQKRGLAGLLSNVFLSKHPLADFPKPPPTQDTESNDS